MPTTYRLTDGNNEEIIEEAAARIRSGSTVIYPTETAYAVGGDALNETVISNVYAAKQRPREKKLTTIVADLDMAKQYCSLTPVEQTLCERFMPGPLTVIAEKKETVPNSLNTEFVFRVSAAETARRLSAQADTPLISTSANRSGHPTSYSVDDIDAALRKHVDIIIDAGELEQQPVSTLIHVENGEVEVVREGGIPAEKLKTLQ